MQLSSRRLTLAATDPGLAPADILVLALFNQQVNRLQGALHSKHVRLDAVESFRTQEGAIVIYSIATSRPEDAPRGMEFLYDLNRLNVATSRARCACIVVASPRLLEPDCKTPRQMPLANAMGRYQESTHNKADFAGRPHWSSYR